MGRRLDFRADLLGHGSEHFQLVQLAVPRSESHRTSPPIETLQCNVRAGASMRIGSGKMGDCRTITIQPIQNRAI